MKAALHPTDRKPDGRKVINDSLSAVFGWFEAAPLPEHLMSLVEQLEAPAQERAAEARAYSAPEALRA